MPADAVEETQQPWRLRLRRAAPHLDGPPDELVAAQALHPVDAEIGAADPDGVVDVRRMQPRVSAVLARPARARADEPYARARRVEVNLPGRGVELLDVLAREELRSGVRPFGHVEALELEDPERATTVLLTPTLIAAYIWGWTGRLERALVALDVSRRRCLERGAEVELVHMTPFTASIRCEAGDLDRARELVEEASERASQVGTAAARAVALGNEASLAGWTGDVERARRCARKSLALFESIGAPGQAFMTVYALGRLELSLGRYEEAAQVLPGA